MEELGVREGGLRAVVAADSSAGGRCRGPPKSRGRRTPSRVAAALLVLPYSSYSRTSQILISVRRIRYEAAAMSPDAGIVTIHAHTIRPAIPQRTAERRFVAPTPTMEPVMVCVVLTGMPKWLAM